MTETYAYDATRNRTSVSTSGGSTCPPYSYRLSTIDVISKWTQPE